MTYLGPMNMMLLVVLAFGTGCSERFKLLLADANENFDQVGEVDRQDSDTSTEISSTGGDDSASDGCVILSEQSRVERIPVDIVIVVDNSPSMAEEIEMVQDSMNHFSGQIAASGVDAHVVLITADSTSSRGICVDKPLGSGDCPLDSNPLTSYFHVSTYISSTMALARAYYTYDDDDGWSHMLRNDAQLHFIVVSDEDSLWGADTFVDYMADRDPPVTDFTFHAIVASADSGEEGPCEGLTTREGKVYKELVAATGGVLADLCLQEFRPVFDELAGEMGAAAASCSWDIPAPPWGEEFDSSKVNVEFINGQKGVYHLGYVETPDDCNKVVHGWFYDNPSSPQQVIVCQRTCDWMQGQKDSEINIILGCETQKAQPVL